MRAPIRRTPGPLVALAGMVLALATLAACSGGQEVGKGIDTSKLGGANGPRLGETTTTAAPAATAPPTTAARGATTTAPKATTTAPKATTTTVAQAFPVAIQADTAGSQFEPRVARVRAGSLIRWTNTDSVPRSVEADDGSFRSASLPPGGTFDYRPPRAGNINYHDGTRPYAVGSLEVV